MSIKKIIDNIKASGAPLVLTGKPIAASMGVALNGETLPRSVLKGWNYMVSTNSVSFFQLVVAEGDILTSSYRQW